MKTLVRASNWIESNKISAFALLYGLFWLIYWV